MQESVTTLGQLFLNTCRAFPKPELLKSKVDGRWEAVSTEEFGRRVRRLSLGLRALGLRPGDKAAILAESAPDWIIADFAIMCAGGVSVPIFPTLPAEQIRYIIDDSEARILFSAGGVLWEKYEAIQARLPRLEKVVCLGRGPLPPGGLGPLGLSLAEAMALGEKAEAADPAALESMVGAIQPDDLASIIYTSGTTGIPKGVMLSHGNFISNIHGLTLHEYFDQNDVILSFLPLSHVLERTGSFLFLFHGCTIVFAENVAAVGENMVEIRPTMMISVPRLFEKIYARVMDQVLAGSAIKKGIFFWGVKVGKSAAALTLAGRRVPRGLALRLKLARKLVFHKILAKTGGRFRFLVCGGAPLAADIMEFFYVAGLVIMAGYGLTETAPVLAANNPTHYRFGTVGTVLPGVELRIAEDGEILARGPNVMKGYYKNEEATQAAFTEDGFFRTGDIGEFDADGYLKITGRIKDIIVTSGGKNISPQNLENDLLTSVYIEQVAVIGDNRKYLSALVVPSFPTLESWAKEQNIPFANRKELLSKPEVYKLFASEMELYLKDYGRVEQIKKFLLLEKEWSQDSGEMTPTMKLKRAIIQKKFAKEIEALYPPE